MSESTSETGTQQQPQEGTAPDQAEAKTFDAEYVDKLRKESARYRTEAKANADAAARLQQIEEANKTEAQKAADRLKAAENEAAEARREAQRYRIATEFNLSSEDAATLEHVTSEDGMRLLAKRLAGNDADRKKQGNFSPREGTTSTSLDSGDDRETVRRLFSG